MLRLASLLRRLRRATTMETGLLEIQADHLIRLGRPAKSSQPLERLSTASSGELSPTISTATRHHGAP